MQVAGGLLVGGRRVKAHLANHWQDDWGWGGICGQWDKGNVQDGRIVDYAVDSFMVVRRCMFR